MSVSLQPEDPLSQVVFVHDYLQLVFQECAFTIYSKAMYTLGVIAIRQGELGFCDALVSLIEQTTQVDFAGNTLSLRFTSGAVVSVESSGAASRGPEAWQFGWFGGPLVVEQNA
jgi:hypothetical protein